MPEEEWLKAELFEEVQGQRVLFPVRTPLTEKQCLLKQDSVVWKGPISFTFG